MGTYRGRDRAYVAQLLVPGRAWRGPMTDGAECARVATPYGTVALGRVRSKVASHAVGGGLPEDWVFALDGAPLARFRGLLFPPWHHAQVRTGLDATLDGTAYRVTGHRALRPCRRAIRFDSAEPAAGFAITGNSFRTRITDATGTVLADKPAGWRVTTPTPRVLAAIAFHELARLERFLTNPLLDLV
ncbi:hypothetical protein [Streptomyces sp. NPDC089919]|uniref:hypothetical protein n=1 Tax=Streptomyces sp. NPDC089919 TaxID=3155188 RepID=UPI00342212FF